MELPRRLGAYLLIRELGHGGMAVVYLAKQRCDLGVERLVALKTIRQDRLDTEFPRLESLFRREARLSASFSHKNIVHLYDVGREGDTVFLTMEYVEGKTLAQLMARRRVPLPVALHIVGEVLDGLAYLHERRGADGKPLGLVHRDVSPQNVLLSYEGAVKLSDFGITTPTRQDHSESAGGLKGKFGYMSPEQAHGLELDARADLFAAGILLFELCTGTPLYVQARVNALKTLNAARRAQIPDLDALQELPASLKQVLRRALAKRPADRYPSAEAMSLALKETAATSGSGTRLLAALLKDTFGDEPPGAPPLLATGSGTLATPATVPGAHAALGARHARRREPAAQRRILLASGALILAAAAVLAIWRWLPVRAPAPVMARPARADLPVAAPPDVAAASAPDLGSDRRRLEPAGRKRIGWSYLSVGARPWARVFLDGQPLGNTPLVDRRVSAGVHRLRLICPATGKSVTTSVDLAPEKRVRRVFDLQ